MAMLWNGAGQPSTWFWIASGVFGDLSGAFFVLVMRLASPEWFDRILTSREHGVVRLLMVPTAIGAVLLFVGQGALMSHGGDVESPLPLVLLLAGDLILLFPILIGGTMSFIVQLTVPRMDAEPTEAAEFN